MSVADAEPGTQDRTVRWVKVLDQTRCIGCHACTTACKSENRVPVGVNRTYVKSVDVGEFPQARRVFQVTRCNQCEDAPCVNACPTSAMYRREDGIVDFDKRSCIGCKACMAACPYDAIFINPDDHSAEKCNFCAHRLEVGLEPACVVVCPVEAILVGDVNDPTSRVAEAVNRSPVTVRRPEKETSPGVFYRGAHQATLDPLGALRPGGGLLAWSSQGPGGAGHVTSGHPRRPSSAAAVLSYDVDHSAPWGWRVSLYTWTKGIAAGTYLASVALVLAGYLSWHSTTYRWVAPPISLAALALTGILLVWDLKHPFRFYMIFTRAQWRSWLVRGAVILSGYALALVAALASSAADSATAAQVVAGFALPLALLTAVYTAYLFAQARGRDLWQSPLLAPHLAVQAVLAGAACLLPATEVLGSGRAASATAVLLGGAAAAHLLMVLAETTQAHATSHARLAVWEMTRGRYAVAFWAGVILVTTSVAAPWIGVAATPLALLGLVCHEHSYVQAGQSVPLA